MDRTLLTRAQAAATLGVRPQQIDVWREKKDLPCSTVKFTGRRYYPEAPVRKWAKQRGKPIYEIVDPKDLEERSKRASSIWQHWQQVNARLPPSDPYAWRSSAKCPECGQQLLVHVGGNKWRCPNGCKLTRKLFQSVDD